MANGGQKSLEAARQSPSALRSVVATDGHKTPVHQVANDDIRRKNLYKVFPVSLSRHRRRSGGEKRPLRSADFFLKWRGGRGC